MMIVRQWGFTLVEVLVALIVASIGLLGVATLSLQATRYNVDAKLRGQATYLAGDMADRIRANPAGALTNYDFPAAVAGVNSNCDTAAPPCTAAERAAQDVWEWNTLVTQLLPGADWSIEAGLPGADDIQITVRWDEILGDYIVNEELNAADFVAGVAQRNLVLVVRP